MPRVKTTSCVAAQIILIDPLHYPRLTVTFK